MELSTAMLQAAIEGCWKNVVSMQSERDDILVNYLNVNPLIDNQHLLADAKKIQAINIKIMELIEKNKGQLGTHIGKIKVGKKAQCTYKNIGATR